MNLRVKVFSGSDEEILAQNINDWMSMNGKDILSIREFEFYTAYINSGSMDIPDVVISKARLIYITTPEGLVNN